jgi:hypothetical protein
MDVASPQSSSGDVPRDRKSRAQTSTETNNVCLSEGMYV